MVSHNFRISQRLTSRRYELLRLLEKEGFLIIKPQQTGRMLAAASGTNKDVVCEIIPFKGRA